MNRTTKTKNINKLTHHFTGGADQLLCNSLKLDCGVVLRNFKVAYKCYGKLNKKKTNAILVCHALTGDQFVSGINPITGKRGWWEVLIGPGKPLDTRKFFIICSNISWWLYGQYRAYGY